jgi:hypothetical protein
MAVIIFIVQAPELNEFITEGISIYMTITSIYKLLKL